MDAVYYVHFDMDMLLCIKLCLFSLGTFAK